MGTKEKLESVFTLLSDHNKVIGDSSKAGFIDPEKFSNCIKISGGTNDQRLKRFSYEDILVCLSGAMTDAGNIKPVILAKEIAGIFRENDLGTSQGPMTNSNVGDGESRPSYMSERSVNRASPAELVAAFDPEDQESPVARRLAGMSRKQPFVVYVGDSRIVDVKTTTTLLLEVKQGYPGRTHINVLQNGKNFVAKVWPLHSYPIVQADENPIYPGRPLMPDQSCDQTNQQWASISLEVRQFIRLLITNGVVKAASIDDAHALYRMAATSDINAFKSRYPAFAVKFDELAAQNKLPTLKMSLNEVAQSGSILKTGTKVIMS